MFFFLFFSSFNILLSNNKQFYLLGAQELFKDFIVHCNSQRFLAHLRDLLILEIQKVLSVQEVVTIFI